LNHCNVLGAQTYEFGEMMQNNGHYVVESRPRSLISVPVKSPYATSHV